MFLALDSKTIILISIFGSLLAIISIVLIVLIMIKARRKRYENKLSKLLEDLSLPNQSYIEAYIDRLKNVSKKNEEYVEIYEQVDDAFDKLIDEGKPKLISRQKALAEKLKAAKKLNKELVEEIKVFENAVTTFVKEINKIQVDLENYFKECDELRVKLTELQEKYKHLTSDLETYGSSLTLCKEELTNYITDIEMYFDIYEENLQCAKYKEATANYESISAQIDNVYGNIETIAQYCNMVDTVIPAQLEELLQKNNDLSEKGYLVAPARVPEVITIINTALEKSKKKFKNLQFGEFEEVAKAIQNKLSETNSLLDQEVVAKNELDDKYSSVNDKVNQCESEFIKVKRKYAKVIEVYKLSDQIQERFSIFHKNCTTLSDLKREYDGFLISKSRNPASYMLEKLNKIEDNSILIMGDIKFFNIYFESIKEKVETIYGEANSNLVALVKQLGTIRFAKAKPVYEKYYRSIYGCIDDFEKINATLKDSPIDFEAAYERFLIVKANTNDLLTSINNELSNYLMVEKSLVYANPLRSQFKDANLQIAEAEESFKNGDYRKAQDTLNYVLNNYHQSAFDKISE